MLPPQSDDFLHQPRADEGVRLAGHEKDGFDFGPKAAIHERHLQFVFVIRDGADAAQDDAGAALGRVVHQQAVEGADLDVGEARAITSCSISMRSSTLNSGAFRRCAEWRR